MAVRIHIQKVMVMSHMPGDNSEGKNTEVCVTMNEYKTITM